MKRNLYTLPAKGSAPLAILATQPSRRVEIQEDGAAAAQGIELFYGQDGFAQGYTYTVGFEPVVLGEKNRNNRGGFVGLPVQKDQSGTVTLQPATTLFKGTSASATPTNVIVTEYD